MDAEESVYWTSLARAATFELDSDENETGPFNVTARPAFVDMPSLLPSLPWMFRMPKEAPDAPVAASFVVPEKVISALYWE